MAFIPMSPQPFANREVVGGEAKTNYHSTKGSDTPSRDPAHGKGSKGEVEESSVSEQPSSMITTNEMSQHTQDSQSEPAILDISFISSNLGMFDLPPSELSPVPPSVRTPSMPVFLRCVPSQQWMCHVKIPTQSKGQRRNNQI